MNQESKGFTLIELLIVIAVLGILSVGVLIALNVTGNLNKASLAKVKTFSASIENDLSINNVGKWSFDDSASPGKDTSGYGNDATPTGASIETAANCGLGFGTCIKVNGTDAYLEGNSQFGDINFKDQPFTISLWVKPTVLAGQYVLIYLGTFTNTNFNFELFISNSSSSPIYGIWHLVNNDTNGRTGIRANTNTLLPVNEWSHIVFVHKGGEPSSTLSEIYLSGKKFPTLSTAGSYGYSPGNIIKIGAGGPVGIPRNFFPGLMDEVAIYNESLTAYQIQHLYAQGLPRHQLAKK